MASSPKKPEMRQLLLTAAESTIIDHGLPGFKARMIADAAGCAVGSIYYHFPDLDDLLLHVNQRTLQSLDQALTRALAGRPRSAMDPASQLRVHAVTYLSFAAAHTTRWRALFEHHLPEGADVPTWYADAQARVFQHVRTPMAELRSELTGTRLDEIVRIAFAAVHGVVSLGLDEKLVPTPLKALQRQVIVCIDLLVRGLQQPFKALHALG